ncbi:MAG: OsmC family peroxiredoxin [Armatimonadetes bacterium]|nr:OsmC family peroxiredoxin [Armatimonadota bacterium]NIM23122.1 OsmC family peroxiredoxin [Armatimonadota bacterium]NIM66990.1 OsmC family peroxiredoxin [Armatimonadota bacterium]NIM75524.1 OsmC family peroxiredoxin [Armatimonadota bacterium]NIN05179.1 OsmC family peroxiredoxin [Armatimonadota bacterium]
MESMVVDYKGGHRFRTDVRGHEIVSDQPPGKGEDTGPTPPELFISSLGACIGVYMVFFAERHNISLEGMKVEMKWEKEQNPPRIEKIQAKIILPSGVPKRYREPLHKSAICCLLHNTINHTPHIEIDMSIAD